MLVSMSEILLKARKEGYGVIAPTMLSMEHIRYSIEAAEEMNSPIILNMNIGVPFCANEDYLELTCYVAREMARRSSVPVALNLDHGKDYNAVLKALRLGFTSVMIDASAKPYEENVALTKMVCDTAHRLGVPVEAELGCVGMADQTFKVDWKYSFTTTTDAELVQDFVEKTGVDFLAVSIGNAHGPYAKDIIPHIEFDLLKKIADSTPIPLVLHGGSGTGDENLGKACRMGICKINVGTDLIRAGIKKATDEVNENRNKGNLFFLTNYNLGFKEKIKYYMDVFGSTNKA